MAKKITVIEVEGKERHIKLGINSLIELEGLLGKPLTALGDSEFSLADLRTMFYVGLKWEDKELTMDMVGELMDSIIEEHGIQYLSEKLAEAMQGAIGASSFPNN